MYWNKRPASDFVIWNQGSFVYGCRRLAVLASVALVLLFQEVNAAEDPHEAGRALAQRVYDRPDGRDETSRGTMVLVESGHAPRVRQSFGYRLDKGNGEVRSLTRFTAPPDIDGVGLLTLDHTGDANDQWLFLPALGRERRIAGSRKGGRFVGSDLFYEDLQDREVDMDNHRLIGREPIEGVMCDVLESTPVDPDNSVYTKRVGWIHPDTLLPLRVDYFQRGKDQPIKRLKVHRIQKIQGYWTIMDSTMTDLKSGHHTRLTIEKIVYNSDLPETLFSRKALEDPAREAEFRPKS